MKTLLLLRHAKTEARAPNGDKDRALTARGRRDAAASGERVRAITGCPDDIVASNARRARQTAEIVAAAVGFTVPITIEPAIYAADTDTLLWIARRLPDAAGCVLLVGHNPGFEQLGAWLSGEGAPPSHLPTAGLLHFEFDAVRWEELRPAAGRLRGVYTPRVDTPRVDAPG